tara:strand:- start:1930 stop:2364 length:435 start_codon:yes stop_codon:yes gene_type:complete
MKKPKIIYVDGVFDLVHYGHFELFKKIKVLIPNSHIIVGISKDIDNEMYKRPSILTQIEKAKTLVHSRYIDEILLDTPWIINQEFINKHNIDYVCHDPIPYSSDKKEDIYKFCKEKGIFLGINRTPLISTSNIISRIVKKVHQM